jgi:lipoprotein-anchoring transpeptidase ErfK/SrfK
MKRLAVAVALACCFAINPAAASVVINIDKSTQRMSVSVDGSARYVWPVSTGRPGYGTPNGVFHPQRMARSWFSKKYYNSPMPHSIFFYHGFAVHGSYEISRLGGPASHGCVRLHPNNAATLYALVKDEGMGATRIVVSGENPIGRRARRGRGDVEPQAEPAPGLFPWFR